MSAGKRSCPDIICYLLSEREEESNTTLKSPRDKTIQSDGRALVVPEHTEAESCRRDRPRAWGALLFNLHVADKLLGLIASRWLPNHEVLQTLIEYPDRSSH